jgi:hypothetical protein
MIKILRFQKTCFSGRPDCRFLIFFLLFFSQFGLIVVDIAANGFSTVDLSPYLDLVENKPPNIVLSYGIKITATAPVSVSDYPANRSNAFAIRCIHD